MRSILVIIAVIIVGVFAWRYYLQDKIMNTESPPQNPRVKVITNMGDVEIELLFSLAPKTVDNFLKLAKSGFYDDTLFHRVIPDFMIQGGDPNTRNGDPNTYGTGGPGYTIPDEFRVGLSNVSGTISMANSGPNTGGSQFFINVADNTYLDGKHAVFGRVTSGMNVVIAISKVPTTGEPYNRPITPVLIESILLNQ